MDFGPLVRFAAEQGFWTLLFVSLFIYVLRESKSREERLMSFLDGITQQFNDIAEQFKRLSWQYDRIAKDVEEIKSDLRKR